MKKEKETVHVYIETDLKKQLTKEAEEKGLKLSSYIRMIIFSRRT